MSNMPKSPYGGGPGAGLTIPPYFKPTPSVKSRNNYYPNSEKLGPDEMRISFRVAHRSRPGGIRRRPASWLNWEMEIASSSILAPGAYAISSQWGTPSN